MPRGRAPERSAAALSRGTASATPAAPTPAAPTPAAPTPATPTPATATPATAQGGSELQRRLARRAALVASAAGDDLASGPPPRALDLGRPARLAPTARGALARTSTFARDHAHGARSLAEGLAYDPALLAASAKDERLAGLDLSRAVYLDTETSGLSGGAGTYVFLVGLGTFGPLGFEVWQGFLADPGDERALLAETAERIAAASAVVSFFGKSFDRHRLEDKMRMHGVTPPFAALPHLDLYWPLRRLFGGRFENGRLKTLERELCGVVRDDDLPGSFAPAAWFDFLGDRPHRLEGVFRHNLEDVLSLVVLLPHAAQPLPERTKPR
ncbi:MAG: ribonuclease H-like domain-containing protein [Planctomycetes bacterium]|nr:ribonuclease H-like domain-containing protein [Planctomycetota bacterium]